MKIFKCLLQAGVLLCVMNIAHAKTSCSPIVIDLGNNGIHLGDKGVGVYFDINADGVREHIQWVRRGGDEGFLALDRSGNGLVDDGAELFDAGQAGAVGVDVDHGGYSLAERMAGSAAR